MDASSSRGGRHGVVVCLVVIIAAASLEKLLGVKLNVPIFIKFNNYRASQANVTFVCVNEITGGRTRECSVAPFARLTFTVTPDPKYNVYAEMTCYFSNTTTDADYLVAIDPYAGMGPNVDSAVLQYEWNIGDSCFDLVRHYVNGTMLTPCLYFWPRTCCAPMNQILLKPEVILRSFCALASRSSSCSSGQDL